MAKVLKFDRDLTEGVINGKHIEGILDIVEKQTRHPVIVEDMLRQVTDIKGMTIEEYEPIKKEFHSYLKKTLPLQGLTEINPKTYNRLVTPIFLQQKIVGYCSFLYEKDKPINYEMVP